MIRKFSEGKQKAGWLAGAHTHTHKQYCTRARLQLIKIKNMQCLRLFCFGDVKREKPTSLTMDVVVFRFAANYKAAHTIEQLAVDRKW